MAVERSIRHAIERAFSNVNEDVLYEVFGNTISKHSGKVTNSCFIATVAEMLLHEKNVAV